MCEGEPSGFPFAFNKGQISNFFEVYKALEGVPTDVKDVKGQDEAIKIIKECIDNYNEHFKK